MFGFAIGEWAHFSNEGAQELYYGTLALVSADNPASSALGGFKEGSSAHRHCRQCLGTSQETTTEVTTNSNSPVYICS